MKQPDEKACFFSKNRLSTVGGFQERIVLYSRMALSAPNLVMSYFELPSVKTFMESLEANSKGKTSIAFLSDHNNYFSQPKKKKFPLGT